MKLLHDPFQVFRSSKTPPGLYARQKWMGESENSQWKSDIKETSATLYDGQRKDGSWPNGPLATVRRLFGLHLTVRNSNSKIDAAIDGLLDQAAHAMQDRDAPYLEAVSPGQLKGLPFIPSHPTLLVTSAALFLASIFERAGDSRVLSLYRQLSREGVDSRGAGFNRSVSHNVFRAMVVHPVFSQDRATEISVEKLAERQTQDGDWGDETAFYQTLNALAHLNVSLADQQVEKAFDRLIRRQRKDGAWGRVEPEWNTFLAIHALKRKGVI